MKTVAHAILSPYAVCVPALVHVQAWVRRPGDPQSVQLEERYNNYRLVVISLKYQLTSHGLVIRLTRAESSEARFRWVAKRANLANLA